MMMVLGFFVFTLKTIPFQQLQQQRQWRHGSNNRIGKRPTMQFLGPDSDSITLSGMLMPSVTGGKLSLYVLEQMAETGRGWPLIRGDGTIYGMYIISEIGKTESDQVSNGAPRKIDFTIKLTRMDESLRQMLGDMSGQLSQLKDEAVNAASKAANTVKSSVGGIL